MAPSDPLSSEEEYALIAIQPQTFYSFRSVAVEDPSVFGKFVARLTEHMFNVRTEHLVDPLNPPFNAKAAEIIKISNKPSRTRLPTLMNPGEFPPSIMTIVVRDSEEFQLDEVHLFFELPEHDPAFFAFRFNGEEIPRLVFDPYGENERTIDPADFEYSLRAHQMVDFLTMGSDKIIQWAESKASVFGGFSSILTDKYPNELMSNASHTVSAALSKLLPPNPGISRDDD